MKPPTEVPQSTSRLGLRRFVAGDVSEVMALHGDPRVRALLVDDHALDGATLAAHFLRGLQALYGRHPGLGIWRAERRRAPDPSALAEAAAAVAAGALDESALDWLRCGSASFAGWFSLMPMSALPDRVEIGCRLRPAEWGTGLVLEGGTTLLDHAFDCLALPAVWAACHPDHRPVQAVLRTLGFEPLGLAPYENSPSAMQFRLTASHWQVWRARPLRQRQLEAVRALAGRHIWPGADPQLSQIAGPVELAGHVDHHAQRPVAAQPADSGPHRPTAAHG